MGNNKKDNAEKLDILGTQDTGWKQTKQKTHQNTQTNTNNVNQTWPLLQTTGGKDESNIVFMQKS